MVTVDDLKTILLLQDVTFPLLEKMLPLIQSREYKEREIVFMEGDRADYFYMLKRGKVLLEVEISSTVIMSLGSVKSGNCFGWSALTPTDAVHQSNALCTEPSEILVIPGNEFLQILDRDPEVGFKVMKNIFAVFKRRLERRTSQLINVIRQYPGMNELVQE